MHAQQLARRPISCKSKVNYLDAALLIQQQILQFDVSVHALHTHTSSTSATGEPLNAECEEMPM